MPNVSIADGFGLDLQAALNPKSAFAKYFTQPPSFSVLQQNLASCQDLPLTAFPMKSTEIGMTFTKPTNLNSAGPQLTGSAAASATLYVKCDGKLFDPDPFGSPIDIPAGSAYLGLGLKANVTPGVSIPSGQFTFGFAGGVGVCFWHYQSFATTPTLPTFKSALQTAVEAFTIPFAPDDLASLGVGDIAVIEGTGSLKLSATLNLVTAVNPLASISVAALPVTLAIQEGAAVIVKTGLTITGELQVRVQKVDNGTVRVGFYRKCGADFKVQVEPEVGITAGTSNFDLISTVLGAIDRSPLLTTAQFKEAGLTEEQQELIVKALKAAIQRQFELSVQAELQALKSQEAAFLYEINLNDLGTDGRAAVQNALRLNLSGLSESSMPNGIREIQSLLTTVRTKRQALKINLLGIYNYTSVNDLTLKGTVLTDPASGEVVITDGATANRISGSINFLADSNKLRKALAQSFLITAAYRCSGLISHAPSLKVSYWHFAEHAATNRDTMTASLHVLTLLGLISPAQQAEKLGQAAEFGRSTFYVNTDYDDALSQSLFLSGDGQPRRLVEYEQTGRKALQQILQSESSSQYRVQILTDDSLWQQLKQTGGTLVNVGRLFPQLNINSQIPLVAGDYLVIEWWAATMANMAQTLSGARSVLSQTPPPAQGSPEFEKVQTDLWRRMADVVRNTQDRFSDPWGVLAMDLASGQRSAASAQIVSTGLILRAERP